MSYHPAVQNVTTALPKLPGFNFPELHEKSTLRKAQSLTFRGGIASVVHLEPVTVKPDVAVVTAQSVLSAFPTWTTLEDKVLRFYAYFREIVAEVPWVRQVTIMFFLRDNAILVTEPGSSNQRFLKKQPLPGVTAETLRVGTSLNIHQRNFTIYDCDDFTRVFYDTMGLAQPPAESCPQNMVSESLNSSSNANGAHNAKRSSSGSGSRKLASAINRSLLENDKKVLRFNAYWIDSKGETRLFSILYYIADATVAIHEVIPPNSGRDPCSNFYKRSSLLKNCDLTAVTKGLDTIAPKTVQNYYTHKDLDVGITLNVYGRQFVVYDADEFTRQFYANEIGKPLQAPLPCPQQRGALETKFNNSIGSEASEANKTMQVELPPHTGIGSDEDSMGSVRYLVLKAPKKDLKKMMEHGREVMRFRAVLHNAGPEDSVRQFVVCFYVGDDTVSIYEQNGTNTGFSAGKFLSRQRVRITGPTEAAQYLCANDFVAGSTVKINSHVFYLQEMDERTAKLLDGMTLSTSNNNNTNNAVPPEVVLDSVTRLRSIVAKKYSRYTDAFRAYNTSKGRGLGITELRRLFDENSIDIESDAHLLAVMRYLDTDLDGFIGFGEFVQFMSSTFEEAAITKEGISNSMKKSSRAQVPQHTYRQAVHEAQTRQFAAQVFNMFREKLMTRRLVMVDAFRIMSDRSQDSKVGLNEFKQVVSDYLQMNLSVEQLDALCLRFFVSAQDPSQVDVTRRLSLREFQRLYEQDVYAL